MRAALLAITLSVAAGCCAALAAEKPLTLDLWPSRPPGDTAALPPEADTTKPEDRLIAGRRVARIGNVSKPTLEIYRPPKEKDTGAAVVIAPGGGHRILAYDLEGTEVAEWLNTLGVTGVVLKYRVPAREGMPRWKAAVQDAQRAVSYVRSRASEWSLDPKKIGILGFSAGGETAGLTAIFENERQYEPVDSADRASCRPDFAVLVYPGGLAEQDNTRLREHVRISATTPPMFLVHAGDDRVAPENSVLTYLALKKAGVPAELHVYAAGGHGYGLRKTDDPVTSWPQRCEAWLRGLGVVK